MGLSWESSNSKSFNDTSISFTFGNTNNIAHFIFSENLVNSDFLFKESFNKLNFVFNSTSINLDFH